MSNRNCFFQSQPPPPLPPKLNCYWRIQWYSAYSIFYKLISILVCLLSIYWQIKYKHLATEQVNDIFNIIHCINSSKYKEHLTDTEKLKITSDQPGIVLDKEQTCSFLIYEPHLLSSLSSEICKHDRKGLHMNYQRA